MPYKREYVGATPAPSTPNFFCFLLDKPQTARYTSTMKIQLSDLPATGTFTKRNTEYAWEVYPNGLVLTKFMVAENPDYEAHISCPGGVLDLDNISPNDVSVGAVYTTGGSCDLGAEWIDQFECLLDHIQDLANIQKTS